MTSTDSSSTRSSITYAKGQMAKGFKTHCILAVFGVLLLIAINFTYTPDFWWFITPVIFWAFSLSCHYVSVFGIPGFQYESSAEQVTAQDNPVSAQEG